MTQDITHWADSEGEGPKWSFAPGTSLPSTTRSQAVDKAMEWVNAGLIYCVFALGVYLAFAKPWKR